MYSLNQPFGYVVLCLMYKDLFPPKIVAQDLRIVWKMKSV